MLLTLCFLPLSLQIEKIHMMGFVCPQNEWFQRDCKPLGGWGEGGGLRPTNKLLAANGDVSLDGVAFLLELLE